MKKTVITANFLWIASFLFCLSFAQVFAAPVQKTKKRSLGLPIELLKDVVLEKASTGLAAASGVVIQAITAMANGSNVDIARALADVPWMKQDVYNVTQAFDSVKIKNGGVLLVSKGDKLALSCLTLPRNRKKNICYNNGKTLVVGIEQQGLLRDDSDEFDHRTVMTIFRLTYVDKFPNLELDGRAFVHVLDDVAGEECSVTLRGASTLVCPSLNIKRMKVHQSGFSKLTMQKLKGDILALNAEDTSIATLLGLNIAQKTKVDVSGKAGSDLGGVCIQGKTTALELGLGSNGSFDGAGFAARDAHVTVKKAFTSATVNASKIFSVSGAKTEGSIEYLGDPEEIRNSSGVSLKRSLAPTALTWAAEKVMKEVKDYGRKGKKKSVKRVEDDVDQPSQDTSAVASLLDPIAI